MFGREGIVSAEKRFRGTSGFKIPACQILQGVMAKEEALEFSTCACFLLF